MNQGKFDRHVFICLNERPSGEPRGSCAIRGAAEVHERMKRLLKERGAHREIRANRAGCLDACEHGVTIVVYPDNVWYGRVTVDDVEAIVDEHLLGGRPVERLRIPGDLLRGRD